MRFEYGVYLLNKNIAQLRWHCGTPTSDLRSTLSNLGSLLESLTTREPEEPLPPVRLVLPVAPAVLKGVAPVLSRGTPTRSQPAPALQHGAAGFAPRESLQSDSESVSSAKDSDSGDAPTAISLDESQEVPPPEASSTALDSAAMRTVNTTESDHPSNDDAHQDLVSSPAFNGLVSSLYDISDNGSGVEEEPAIVDGSIIENSGTSPPSSSSGESLPPPANGRTEEGRSGGEDPELGVAADLFWDSVTSRAQVLSVPTSFKVSRQKPFSQF
jgi:hypothetical protein